MVRGRGRRGGGRSYCVASAATSDATSTAVMLRLGGVGVRAGEGFTWLRRGVHLGWDAPPRLGQHCRGDGVAVGASRMQGFTVMHGGSVGRLHAGTASIASGFTCKISNESQPGRTTVELSKGMARNLLQSRVEFCESNTAQRLA